MKNSIDNFKNQFFSEITSLKKATLNESKLEKDMLLYLASTIDDLAKHLNLFEEKIFISIVERFPNDAEVWYLYSLYVLSTHQDYEEAFKVCTKSIQILERNRETTSAFSRHYIELAIKLKKFSLANKELVRIANLVDLSLIQKRYFRESLKILNDEGLLLEEYADALDK